MTSVLSEAGARKSLQLVPHDECADVLGAAHMVPSGSNGPFGVAVVAFIREMARGG